MKKKLFGFLTLLALAIGSLMFSMPLNTQSVYATDADPIAIETNYVRDSSGKIVKTDKLVATTIGYGEYVLGTKDIILTATLEPGFKLVGWYVNGTFVNSELKGGEFFDADSQDGKYLVDLENHTFTIVNAEESLKINPVAEYIEFVADFSAFESVVEGSLPEMVTYHLGDTFEKTFNIKNKIDISHVYLNGEEQPKSKVEILINDANKCTTSVHIKYEVTEDVTITLDYTNLYQAKIKPYVKNPNDESYTLATGEEAETLLETITAVNVFSKISNDTYLVKNSKDNSNFIFKIVAVNVSKSIDSRTYYYYTLSNSTPTEQGFDIINSDFEVEVRYDSTPYTIDFTFAVYENGFVSVFPDGGYNTETPFSVERGSDVTIEKTSASNNFGYEFYGFVQLTDQEISGKLDDLTSNTSISLTIDKLKPENQHVYMLFKKVHYSVKLTGYNTMELQYRLNKIYPLNKATLSFERESETYSQSILSGQLKDTSSVTFDAYTISVTDTNVIIRPITNVGFAIAQYKIVTNGTESEAFNLVDGAAVFSLTPEFIEQYVYNNSITIKFVEDYEYYSVTYYTMATADVSLSSEGKVFMADLDVTLPEGAEKTEETFEDVKSITITKLIRYSSVTLKSQGVTIEGKTYNFVKFITADGATTYYPENAGLSNADLTLMIDKSLSINVIYCVPSVHFGITTIKPEVCDLFACVTDPAQKIRVLQGDEIIAPDEDDVLSWTIDLSNGHSNSITVRFDTADVIKFGYNFKQFILRQASQTGEIEGITSKEESVYYFKFTISSQGAEGGLGYNLSLDFETTTYDLTINKTYNEDTTDTENVSFTIEEPIVEFEMLQGYYANYVTFGSEEKIEYAELEHDNSYNSNIFSCDFTNLLKDIVETGNTITMDVVFKLHTYQVQVIYGLTNPKGSTIDRRVVYPEIGLNYESIILRPTYQDNKAIFEGIEYGKDIEMNVGSIVPGLAAAGWFADDKGNVVSYEHSSTDITIPNVTSNKTIYYKLTYISYNISLIVKDVKDSSGQVLAKDNAVATPVARVNNKVSTTISLFDYLTINAGANVTNGFKLKSINFLKPTLDAGTEMVESVPYSKFNFDAEEWKYAYNKLFYKDGNQFVRNYSSTSVEGRDYYYLSEQMYYDSSFDMSKYVANDNLLIFTLEYEYKDIVFTELNNGTNLIIQKDTYEISPNEFATYEIWVTRGTERIKVDYTQNLPENKITYLDSKVEIYVNFATCMVEGKEYLLSHGVQLSRIMMLGINYNFTKVTDQQYRFTFNVDDILPSAPADGVVQISYNYTTVDKYITLTTNVTDLSFYQDGKFKFACQDHKGRVETDGSSAKLTRQLNFLGKVELGWTNGWQQYFEIKSLQIYQAQTNVNGYPIFDGQDLKIDYSKLIPESEYANFGIYMSGDLLSSLEMNLIDNIIIVLKIEPKLIFGLDSIQVGNDHYFKPIFKYEETSGVGKSNELHLGSDIIAHEKVQKRLKLTYINVDTNEEVATPINVGKYEVIVSLKDADSAEDFPWLRDISLSYKIFLEIQRAKLRLNYDNIAEVYKKTYDGNALYKNPMAFVSYLRIEDGKRLNVSYVNQNTGSSFVLLPNIIATITYTDSRGLQQSNSNANIGYNITLSNIKLDYTSIFNNNFELESEEIILKGIFTIEKAPINILGVIIKDKKWDGTDIAISDLSHARLDDKAIVAGDDVRLSFEDLKLVYRNLNLEDPYGEHDIIIPDETYAKLLVGSSSGNYKLVEFKKRAKIYRASISAEVEDVGTITLFNNTDIVDLIPLDAELVVNVVPVDSLEYTLIYANIADYLVNNSVYAVGYRFAFNVNNVRRVVDKQLTLQVPSVDKLTNAGWLSDKQSGTFDYETKGNYVIIQLNEQENVVDLVFLTNQRVLLQLWQVILIIAGAVVLVGGITAIVLVVRHNKIKKLKNRDII